MNATITIIPIRIIGANVKAVNITYRTDQGTQGLSGNLYVTTKRSRYYLRDIKIALRESGVRDITVVDSP